MARVIGIILAVAIVVVGIWQAPNLAKLAESGWNSLTQKSQQALNQTQQQTLDIWSTQLASQSLAAKIAAKLTDSAKQEIDIWLESKKLNQYGDQQGMAYTGGTPLFNEKTGQTIDRYAYLLMKFPELITQFKLDQLIK